MSYIILVHDIKKNIRISDIIQYGYYILILYVISRSQKVDLVSFYFLSYFYFIFDLSFIFSIFRTLGLGLEVISHTVTSVTSDGMVTTLIMGLKRRE